MKRDDRKREWRFQRLIGLMKFNKLFLKNRFGIWGGTARCDGVVLDGETTIGNYYRNKEELKLEIGSSLIHLVGPLPTTKFGGSGKVLLNNTVIGTIECREPESDWIFFDLFAKQCAVIHTGNPFAKIDAWKQMEKSFWGKIKYILGSNLEVRAGGLLLESAQIYMSSKRPLLSEQEQEKFNNELLEPIQTYVLTGIVLIQSTCGFGRGS